MTTETLNGLLTQKPGRDPQQGEIKLFTIEHRKGKSGKPYIKIKNSTAENGGQPYRILSAEKTDFVDQHGNISFSIEVEATTAQPTSFANARATMQGDHSNDDDTTRVYDKGQHMLEPLENTPLSPPHAQQGEDGVTEARKHLMRCCNLYNLCIAAVDKAIAPNLPEVARTSEQFQATLASLWIEASSRRCTNGVDWWSWIDRMPDKPLPVNGGKKSATVKPIQKEEEDSSVPF